jgi:hypothetical protein
MGQIQRVTGLRTPEQFRAHLARIGARLPLCDTVTPGGALSEMKRGAKNAPRKE